MSFQIAIDGPAGAGKSSIAKRLAKELNFIYVDTGAMYRTIAYFLAKNNVDIEDEKALEAALEQISIEIGYENGSQQMILNQENVNARIRTPEVTLMASKSSAKPQVRAKLLNVQRDMASRTDVLMDGRDIGTTILPNADLKIYLTASVEARAMRRYLQMKEGNQECDLKEIQRDIEERDYNDMHRAVSPLAMAEDAILLDTSDMNIEQVIEAIKKMYREVRDQK